MGFTSPGSRSLKKSWHPDMAPTIDQFVATVRESGLLSHDLLESTIRELSGDGFPSDATRLADVLVARGHLTGWQAEKLLAGVERGFFLGKHKLLKLIANGVIRHFGEQRMRPGMVADLVAIREDSLDEFGQPGGVLSNHEEGGLDVPLL